MSTHINELRKHLMDTLADLRNKDNPMEPDRARAVAQVAGVLVDTAKVEIDYLKATGQHQSAFLESPEETPRLTTETTGLSSGINSITRHRLQG